MLNVLYFLKLVLKKLIENWGLVALVFAILFFFMWSQKRTELETANDKITELTSIMAKQQEMTEKLTSDKTAIEKELQKALDTIQSDDCGKTPVPEYLLKKQKEILGVIKR